MSKSILETISSMLGLGPVSENSSDTSMSSYNAFLAELVAFINSALYALCQIGIGPENGFRISDSVATWKDFIGDDESILGAVQDYVFFSVKLKFDPPTSSFVNESYKSLLKETEWRLLTHPTDKTKGSSNGGDIT